jgi:hypothetical protein
MDLPVPGEEMVLLGDGIIDVIAGTTNNDIKFTVNNVA